ncbi:MAG: hypothetical protein GWN84_06620 [Gammaproteobacteria bacterium]|nr:hypothetical protein [Gammaproteobacteria bacterium]NIR82584.1 hypothetical protein [Gammaproteobacteria bacterium]NIR88787.1 hypothetical protein [Gammaproteobacteria bacterium]NIV73992.1 hypothetical protein [Gammaproteobacteria bacterium]
MSRTISNLPMLGAVLLTLAAGPALAQQGGVSDGTLGVVLSEWSMGFNQTSTADGDLRVRVSNAGQAPHNLTIESSGGRHYVETTLLPPGASRTLEVDLPDGTYEVYCNVPGHRKFGMEATLTVGGAAETEPESGGGGTGGGGYY